MARCNCKLNLNKSPPLAYFLPFHYHLIPGTVRTFLASNVFKPAPISNIQELCLCQKEISENIIWPNNHEVAFVLTYDIDTHSGLKKVLALKKDPFFSKIKSTVNLVTHGYSFKEEELETLKSDGWEIAIHGDNHDAKLVFEKRIKINSRLKKSKEKLIQMGTAVFGIRSPSLLYTEKYFEVLEKHFAYDSSMCFDDGPFSVFKIFPFKIGNLLEIPISMPMDVQLKFLNFSDEERFTIWSERFNFIKKHRGVAVLVVHPDDHFFTEENEETLKRFLIEVQRHNPLIATCHEIFELINRVPKSNSV